MFSTLYMAKKLFNSGNCVSDLERALIWTFFSFPSIFKSFKSISSNCIFHHFLIRFICCYMLLGENCFLFPYQKYTTIYYFKQKRTMSCILENVLSIVATTVTYFAVRFCTIVIPNHAITKVHNSLSYFVVFSVMVQYILFKNYFNIKYVLWSFICFYIFSMIWTKNFSEKKIER